MQDIMRVGGLKKYFGPIKAVDNIDFRVKAGEKFAFLGLNGAGKSTTIAVICGQISKDAGRVEIDGVDLDDRVDEVKARLGVVFQDSKLDMLLSVRDNLQSRAALYGISGAAFSARLNEITDLMQIGDLLKRPLGKLSGGQRRRIDIARALFHRPKILILDEPTTGLDPQSRQLVWRVIDELIEKENLTVFLTTHYMEEAAEADYVVILDSGAIAAEGTPLELKNRYTGDFIRLYGADSAKLEALGLTYTLENGYAKIPVAHTSQAAALIAQNPELFDNFEVVKGTMDDVFLTATGKTLRATV